jgi:peptidoglycan/LPS O-acetylase OafA/YrhL
MHLQSNEKLSPVKAYPELRNPRYNSLDMWRGVGCLMVVFAHGAFFAKPDFASQQHAHRIGAMIVTLILKGWIGVPIFFVISGYCIAATADSSRRRAHPTWNYFKRRMRRVYPPYWAAAAFSVACGCVLLLVGSNILHNAPHTTELTMPNEMSPAQWIGSLTLTEMWRPHIGGGPALNILPPAWTLCYEEQFYAICGVLLLVATRRFFAGAVVVTLATIFTFWLSATHPAMNFSGFFLDGRWLMFAAGMLVYHHLNYQQPGMKKWIAPALLVLGMLACKALPHVYRKTMTYDAMDMLYTIWVALLFSMAILLMRPLDKKLTNMRILWPLAQCGQKCYSLYLLHWTVCAIIGHWLLAHGVHGIWPVLLITMPITTVASFVVAAVFYRLVESKFLNTPAYSPAHPKPIPQVDLAPAAV